MRYEWDTIEEACIHPTFEHETRDVVLAGHIHARAPSQKEALRTAQLHWLLMLHQATGIPVRFRTDM